MTFYEEIIERLEAHIGHEIVISPYAGECVTLECETCGEVIVDEEVLLQAAEEEERAQRIALNVERTKR